MSARHSPTFKAMNICPNYLTGLQDYKGMSGRNIYMSATHTFIALNICQSYVTGLQGFKAMSGRNINIHVCQTYVHSSEHMSELCDRIAGLQRHVWKIYKYMSAGHRPTFIAMII